MDKETILIVLGVLLFFAIAFELVGTTIYLIEKNLVCPQFADSTEKLTKYNFWAGGCFVQLENGQWIRSSKYIGANLENK